MPLLPWTRGPGPTVHGPASEEGMCAKRVCSVAMLVAALGGVARGQEPLPRPEPTGAAPQPAATTPAPANPLVPAPPNGTAGLPPGSVTTPWSSPWINYPQGPGCCGPVGGNGPISTEL